MCKYCGLQYSKIARHLENVHAHEPEVAKVLTFHVKSKERKCGWELLRNEGNYLHNFEVLKQKRGVLIPKYRQQQLKDPNNYLPCEFCKAMYSGSMLRDHQQRCSFKDIMSAPKKRNQSVTKTKPLLPITSDNTSSFYTNVIAFMKDDAISKIVHNDQLILDFGKRKWAQNNIEVHTANIISGKMRELGRLVLAARSSAPSASDRTADMSYLLKP